MFTTYEKYISKPEVNVLTIIKAFSGVSFYQVPDFQRPYAWDDDQIDELWDDIYNAVFVDKSEYYFIGPSVLAKSRENHKELYKIIDGQQRLTTLMILFCVIRDTYFSDPEITDKLSDNKLPGFINDIIEHSTLKEYRLSLMKWEDHHGKFKREILEEIKFEKISSKKDWMKVKRKSRYLYVAHRLKEKIDKLVLERGLTGLEELINYILHKVLIVAIYTWSENEGITIFQTLNTRGLDLTPADIVKANIYDNMKDKKLFISQWQELEGISRRLEISVTDVLTYLAYYLSAPDTLKKTVDQELIKRLKINENADKAIDKIIQFAKILEDLEDLKTKSYILISLSYLPHYWWKVILSAAKLSGYNEIKLLQLARDLRRFYYLYWIAGYTAQKVRYPSLRIVGLVKEGKNIDEINSELKKSLEDDEVEDLAKNNLISRNVADVRWIKPLLLSLESELTTPAKIITYDVKRVWLEHILPDKWQSCDYWKERWKEEEAEKWLNRLGNLTLLDKKLNKSASNSPFPIKKDIYAGRRGYPKTSFELTRQLQNYNNWTIREIEIRHNQILKEICNKILKL